MIERNKLLLKNGWKHEYEFSDKENILRTIAYSKGSGESWVKVAIDKTATGELCMMIDAKEDTQYEEASGFQQITFNQEEIRGFNQLMNAMRYGND
jgi:hypothetical protein